jgi:hypothetical protein
LFNSLLTAEDIEKLGASREQRLTREETAALNRYLKELQSLRAGRRSRIPTFPLHARFNRWQDGGIVACYFDDYRRLRSNPWEKTAGLGTEVHAYVLEHLAKVELALGRIMEHTPLAEERREEAKVLNAKAASLKRIHQWSPYEARDFYNQTTQDIPISVLGERGRKDPEAVNVLADIARRALQMMLTLAVEGSRKATEDLVALLLEAVNAFNSAKGASKAMKAIAPQMTEWPVTLSFHPKKIKEAEHILAALQVGLEAPITSTSGSRSGRNDPVTTIAQQLYDYIVSMREGKKFDYGMPWRPLVHGLDAKALPQSYLEAARSLAPFSPATASKWWDLARRCFRDAYPSPSRHLEFENFLESKKQRETSGVRKTSIPDLDSKIVEKIGNRFKSLAGRKGR